MTAGALSMIPEGLRESILVKALAAYASMSWLLLQIVSTFVSGLGLPDWVFTGFLLILGAGLPVLIVAARASTRQKTPAPAAAPILRFGRMTFRRAALGGSVMLCLWVMVVGSFMASWAFGIGPAASLLAAGTLSQSDPVLIADFKNRSRDPMLASTVTEAVRLDLSQSNVIRVVDRDDVQDALERMSREPEDGLPSEAARDLAVREGMPAVLEGEVSSLGTATLIAARLVDPRTGAALAEYHERAKGPEELLDAVDRLSSTLRNKIGEPLTTLRDEPPLAKVTTSSMPALRAFTEANAAHGRGDKERAVVLLQTALSHDRTFPMAWRKLGTLLNDDNPVAAKEAYSNAYKLRANLPQRERGLAEGSYFKNVVSDLPRAMEAYRGVLTSHPDDEIALNNLANLYTAFQKPIEALKLQERIVSIRPRYAAYSNLFNSLIRLGQLDRARQIHLTAIQLYPDQKRIKFQPIILAFASGDYAAADREMDQFLKASRGKEELENDLFVARYLWKRGRLDQAVAIFRERARIADGKGKPSDAIEAMTSLVAIARAKGKTDEGRAILAEALAAYPLDKIEPAMRPHVDLAEAYALVGDAARARNHLALAEGQGWVDGTLNYDQRRRAEGLIALAEGRSDEALKILEAASKFGQCSTCLLYDLGLAAEAAGRDALAIEAYGNYVRNAPFALTRGEQLGFVLSRLAQLHHKGGNRQAADVAREQLEQVWRGTEALANTSSNENQSAG